MTRLALQHLREKLFPVPNLQSAMGIQVKENFLGPSFQLRLKMNVKGILLMNLCSDTIIDSFLSPPLISSHLCDIDNISNKCVLGRIVSVQ